MRRLQQFVLAILLGTFAAEAMAAESAVILTYNRFGERGSAALTLKPETFDQHLAELARGGYTVMPVADIVGAIRAGRSLPDKAVGLTFDEAHASFYAQAWPRLKAAQLPFTLFATTAQVDAGGPEFMTWDQLAQVAQGGGTIGHRSERATDMPLMSEEEIEAALADSSARFITMLGKKPSLFAYPMGSFGAAARGLVAEHGFDAAFGLHGAPVHPGSDPYALPRFTLSDAYGTVGRLRMIATSLPIRTKDVTPTDPRVTSNPPAIGFTIDQELRNRQELRCFTFEQTPILEWLGSNRVEIRFARPLPQGRVRLTCTMPGQAGRWHWLGMQVFVAPP